MDLAVQANLAGRRTSHAPVNPLAEAEPSQSVKLGSLAPHLQIAAPAKANDIRPDRARQPDERRADRLAPLQPVASLADLPANRYRYKVAHEPGLDRPLLQMIDENTDQIVLSLPPEQLARMLEDAKALIEDRLKEPHAKHLDTSA
jgi:hypothetical protein